jgi:hypothetical protein
MIRLRNGLMTGIGGGAEGSFDSGQVKYSVTYLNKGKGNIGENINPLRD